MNHIFKYYNYFKTIYIVLNFLKIWNTKLFKTFPTKTLKKSIFKDIKISKTPNNKLNLSSLNADGGWRWHLQKNLQRNVDFCTGHVDSYLCLILLYDTSYTRKLCHDLHGVWINKYICIQNLFRQIY